MGNIPDVQADKITAAKLAVDSQVEHGQITNGMRILEVDANSLYVFWFEGRFLADQLPLIPGFSLVDGFHDRLLGCLSDVDCSPQRQEI